jgi:adenylylsulfate kinase
LEKEGDAMSAYAATFHHGLVVWLTGLPSAGKSTLAARVCENLRAAGLGTLVLDGDEVRAALRPEPGYDEAGRDAFYETLARLAALAAEQGLIVLVPATAHRCAFRDRARALTRSFVEVFVDTPLAECRRRDSKGLYERASTEAAGTLPGAQLPYEPPDRPELVCRYNEHDACAKLTSFIIRQLPRHRSPPLPGL